jgi:hypothetical protein
VIQLDAPPYLLLGSTLHMTCTYDLEGEKLYRLMLF